MASAPVAPTPAVSPLPANGTTAGNAMDWTGSAGEGVFVCLSCVIGILFAVWQFYQV